MKKNGTEFVCPNEMPADHENRRGFLGKAAAVVCGAERLSWTQLHARTNKVANALLTIEIDGEDHLALAKDVQRDPIRPVIEHIDLVVVRLGEKVNVDVPIHLVGTSEVETVVSVENNTVELSVEATQIPERVEVSIEGLPAGTQIHASDLVLPTGAELLTDADSLIVNITQAISAEELEAEMAAELEELGGGAVAAAEAEGAEPAEGAEAPAAEVEKD